MDDMHWEPPSEAEMKVIQARRERQDKISKLMGDYLLKGYRMLGDCCQDCGTILLQDKQRKLYCVACQELDSDVDKDNPALNAQAALSQVRERQLASSTTGSIPDEDPPLEPSEAVELPPVPRPEHCEGAASGLRATAAALPLPLPLPVPTLPKPSNSPVPQTPSPPKRPAEMVLESAEEAVLQKIGWAAQQLRQAGSVEFSMQLCELLRTCAESLKSIKELQQ
ncbi:protein ZNRD2 [Ambystoma mexicanum]|uniref:protein ZNRD2 n=1 Tax=Ambystoma mexicanum TaxID=8296 RepID=UPI0037E927DE